MRKLIIGLLILAGLAVVIDFSVAAYSEYRVSRALRTGADLAADPEVSIGSFPFLVEAANGRYDKVLMRAYGKRPDIPGELPLEATLTGVRLPLHELVDGSLRNVPVEQIDSSLRIKPTELGRLFNIPNLQVHGAEADKSDGTGGSGGSGMTTTDGKLCLTGTLPEQSGAQFAGENVAVQADLFLDGGQVKIVATGSCKGADTTTVPVAMLPEQQRPAVLAAFTRTIDIKELPFGVQPMKVRADGGQIVVQGKGVNVTIDLDRLQQP
ncbi:LmeA family phospholipid-binding protein [Nocardia sp. NPDC049149]|uniref:LmeA family phospholipid-binding protein n=1 Tax=Nocardia sp. NPDC049149 TaxID=3364315 RepID=UPI0037182807